MLGPRALQSLQYPQRRHPRRAMWQRIPSVSHARTPRMSSTQYRRERQRPPLVHPRSQTLDQHRTPHYIRHRCPRTRQVLKRDQVALLRHHRLTGGHDKIHADPCRPLMRPLADAAPRTLRQRSTSRHRSRPQRRDALRAPPREPCRRRSQFPHRRPLCRRRRVVHRLPRALPGDQHTFPPLYLRYLRRLYQHPHRRVHHHLPRLSRVSLARHRRCGADLVSAAFLHLTDPRHSSFVLPHHC